MSATSRGGRGADPLAAALRTVVGRHGQNYLKRDDLSFARQVREVAQICWMQAGEPERLRSEDSDRAEVCADLVRTRAFSRGRDPEKRRAEERARRLRLVHSRG